MNYSDACGGFGMNTIVVIEDQETRQRHECEPFKTGNSLDIQCLCGAPVHPIVGAWCRKCGAKVVQVRQFS
jgi:hypothetical protein